MVQRKRATTDRLRFAVAQSRWTVETFLGTVERIRGTTETFPAAIERNVRTIERFPAAMEANGANRNPFLLATAGLDRRPKDRELNHRAKVSPRLGGLLLAAANRRRTKDFSASSVSCKRHIRSGW